MPSTIGATASNPLASTESTLDPALLKPPDQFGKDTFLKLLVAQLKYQNPLDPMDGSEFMAQTAQFTTVEKLTELTDQLTESLVNERLGTATGMIGRDVTFVHESGSTATQRVTSVKFAPTGPLLVMADGSEIGLGQIQQVAAAGTPPAAITPARPAVAAPAAGTTDPDPEVVAADPTATDPADPTGPAEPTGPADPTDPPGPTDPAEPAATDPPADLDA